MGQKIYAIPSKAGLTQTIIHGLNKGLTDDQLKDKLIAKYDGLDKGADLIIPGGDLLILKAKNLAFFPVYRYSIDQFIEHVKDTGKHPMVSMMVGVGRRLIGPKRILDFVEINPEGDSVRSKFFKAVKKLGIYED